MLPFEFTVKGPPFSHQTRDKAKLRAWQDRVRMAASQRWGSKSLEQGRLRIIVTYYHEESTIRMDNDNMLKPIQDSLNGLVYADDRQIVFTRRPGQPRRIDITDETPPLSSAAQMRAARMSP